jgi:hypothetical protein
MRFGKSADPELDFNHQMGLYMDELNIRPLPPPRPLQVPPSLPQTRHRLAQGPSHYHSRIQGHHFQLEHIKVDQRRPDGYWCERHWILLSLLQYGQVDCLHRGWGA